MGTKVHVPFYNPIDKGDEQMRLNKNLGMILLAIYLIIVGLEGLGILSLGGLGVIAAICALGAGILILINR